MTDEYAERVVALAARGQKRAAELLAPMEREMKIMDWPPEYRQIMWEAVARRPLALARGHEP